MTDEQIRFYAECRVLIPGDQRIRTMIEEHGDGRRFLVARTSPLRIRRARWVSIELHPDTPPDPKVYREAALVLAGRRASGSGKMRVLG
jgi:hypothetical protein